MIGIDPPDVTPGKGSKIDPNLQNRSFFKVGLSIAAKGRSQEDRVMIDTQSDIVWYNIVRTMIQHSFNF